MMHCARRLMLLALVTGAQFCVNAVPVHACAFFRAHFETQLSTLLPTRFAVQSCEQSTGNQTKRFRSQRGCSRSQIQWHRLEPWMQSRCQIWHRYHAIEKSSSGRFVSVAIHGEEQTGERRRKRRCACRSGAGQQTGRCATIQELKC